MSIIVGSEVTEASLPLYRRRAANLVELIATSLRGRPGGWGKELAEWFAVEGEEPDVYVGGPLPECVRSRFLVLTYATDGGGLDRECEPEAVAASDLAAASAAVAEHVYTTHPNRGWDSDALVFDLDLGQEVPWHEDKRVGFYAPYDKGPPEPGPVTP